MIRSRFLQGLPHVAAECPKTASERVGHAFARLDRAVHIDDANCGFGFLVLRWRAEKLGPKLEEVPRRGEIQFALALAAIFLLKDNILAIASLEHCFEVLAVLNGVNQTGGLGLLRRQEPVVEPTLHLRGVRFSARAGVLPGG